MVSRRIVIAALVATALVGLLFGGVIGVLGGGGDDGSPVAAVSPTSTAPGGPPPGPSSAPPVTSAASTSASPGKSPTTSKPPTLKAGQVYVLTAGGRAMDVYGGEKDDNTPVIVFPAGAGKANQQWTVQDAGGGYVYLISRVSNKCLDMKGGHAVQDNCGDQRQQWQAQPSGKGFVLVSREGGQALGMGDQVKGQQGLRLVPAANGTVWTFTPAG